MNYKRFHPYRVNSETRDKYADIWLKADDFIYPYFVVDGENKQEPIATLKGIHRFSVDRLLIDLERTVLAGIDKILLFGVVEGDKKNAEGSWSKHHDSVVCKAIRAVKQRFPNLMVITDICLCAYTNHGHCGILNNGGNIENDLTLPKLADMALAHARAGADMVSPSAMMDGQVLAIRQALSNNGFNHVKIMGYSAKYASNFYGPFRDAAQSAPGHGNRKSYQMDFRTRHQGIDEVASDIEEGANWVMVKPAHTYLDVIARASDRFPEIPTAAYHTSGEFMMIVTAAEHNLLDEHEAMIEVLTAIKRAGASYIISYYARNYLDKIN